MNDIIKRLEESKITNDHIVDYLDYYIDSEQSPEYAILLKGAWGAGKTWFIKNYLKREERKSLKTIYVSLYGVTSFSEIEDQFFQQLHPILSSKAMSITGKVVKGLLKTTLKIDLDRDGTDDGSINSSIPEINLPEYLKDTNERVLIFDDLERCNIPFNDVLGYINYFVEHQGQKVIILANEDEILKNQSKDHTQRYKDIKEKLIGKTFKILPNISEAMEHFLSLVSSVEAKTFLEKNKNILLDIYIKSGHNNLRNLKQAIWDFERLNNIMPSEFKGIDDFTRDLLKQVTSLAIEIRQGTIIPSEIVSIAEYNDFVLSGKQDDEFKKNHPYKKFKEKYPFVCAYSMIPNQHCWYEFFEKGSINKDLLKSSVSMSPYFKNDTTEDWVKLWRFYDLNDQEFNDTLSKVTARFSNHEYKHSEVIRHITGTFLHLSKIKLIKKTSKQVLDESIKIINQLHKNSELEFLSDDQTKFRLDDGFAGLGFMEKNSKEFVKVSDHLKKINEEIKDKKLSVKSQELLQLIDTDPNLFYRRIVLCNSPDQTFYDTPIFCKIEPQDFFDKIIKADPENMRTVFYAFDERYKFPSITEKLTSELAWLKKLSLLFINYIKANPGKLSSHVFDQINRQNLKSAIKNLESASSSKKASPKKAVKKKAVTKKVNSEK